MARSEVVRCFIPNCSIFALAAQVRFEEGSVEICHWFDFGYPRGLSSADGPGRSCQIQPVVVSFT